LENIFGVIDVPKQKKMSGCKKKNKKLLEKKRRHVLGKEQKYWERSEEFDDIAG